MMNCWQNQAEARPSFAALTKQLKDMENQHTVRSTKQERKNYLFIEKKNLLNFEMMLAPESR